MSPSLEQLQARVAALEAALADVRGRLDRVEGRREGAAARRAGVVLDVASTTPAAASTAAASVPSRAPESPLALAGRTLLTLAGAYLIRALADDGRLPPLAGAWFGLAYGLGWTGLAALASRRGQRLSAAFHSLASALVTYPLLLETSVRLAWLPARVALGAVVLCCAAGLAVGVRERFSAWLHVGMAIGTLFLILVGSRELLAAAASLIAVAALVEAFSLGGPSSPLRWLAALGADAGALLLVGLLARAEGLPASYSPVSLTAGVGVSLGLALLYLASIALRTLARGAPAAAFEVTQGALAVLLGFGGAGRLLTSHGGSAALLGLVALALGLACYAVAFAFVARQKAHGANFHFYSTSGLLLVVLGSAALLSAPGRGAAWPALALVAAELSRRFGRTTLSWHAAALLVAATLSGGLGRGAASALFVRGSPVAAWPAEAWLALAAAAAGYALLASRPTGARGQLVALALIAALAALGTAGALVGLVRLWGLVATPHATAALRTLALAGLATALALAAGRLRRPELAWLVYPVLGLGGLKLLLEDLPTGRPASLVASFVVYGGALILAPRLLRPER